MKKATSLLLGCAIAIAARSQSVGIGTNAPNASAQLDITATNKGLLIPRMNTAAITAIPNPAKGLMVLDTAKNQLVFNIGTPAAANWQTISFNSGWSTTGNAGNNATNFIGTTDNVDMIFKRNNLRAGLLNTSNTSWGVEALNLNAAGNYNTANGYQALNKNTDGSSNTAMGLQSLFSNTTGGTNTAVGAAALALNNTGYSNVAVGVAALQKNTNRSNLVAIGDSALYNNGTGTSYDFQGIRNTAIGSKALFNNTIGVNNTATGDKALYSNIGGSNNTAIGYVALQSNQGGSFNTSIGAASLGFNNSGNNNIAIGYASLNQNETGGNNTAIGNSAGFSNTGGSNNVFIGYNAGYDEAGSNKLYISNGQTNAANTLVYGEFDNKILSIGGKLGIGISPVDFPLEIKDDNSSLNRLVKFYNGDNVAKWHLSMYSGLGVPAGKDLNFSETDVADFRLYLKAGGEVGIGKIPLTSNTESRLQIKQNGLQNGIGVEAANSTNHWDFYATGAVASDFSLWYNGAFRGSFDNVTGAYTAASDRRMKKDISAQIPVLNNVMQLQAYQYHYLDNQPTDRFSNGFMAQDVQQLFPDAVVENTMKDGQKRLGINYQYFTVLAIKGLQEQQQQIQTLEQRLAKLEALIGK